MTLLSQRRPSRSLRVKKSEWQTTLYSFASGQKELSLVANTIHCNQCSKILTFTWTPSVSLDGQLLRV